MFEIVLTPEAIDDMRSLRKFERQRIFDEIEKQLQHQPAAETRNRKRLHPNNLAEWELRIGKFRVFYDVDRTDVLRLKRWDIREATCLLFMERSMSYENCDSIQTLEGYQCAA